MNLILDDWQYQYLFKTIHHVVISNMHLYRYAVSVNPLDTSTEGVPAEHWKFVLIYNTTQITDETWMILANGFVS